MNFNKSPYFDDFDASDNFYRVLFKPGYAIQARELNQLQSILQHQISGVGNHLFKKNATIIPGNIKIIDTADIILSDDITDPASFVGKTITNTGSIITEDSDLEDSVTALVLGYKEATTTTSAALYIKYIKTKNDDNTTTFAAGETLYTVDSFRNSFDIDADGVLVGRVATVDAGTFYTKEIFVDSEAQTIIIETDNSNVTNCTIGFEVIESIITSSDDSTLLDNSEGSSNQYAPGADRYKISLNLVRVDDETTISEDNFIIKAKIENNVITTLNNTTSYNEILDTLARRTYDINGNFIVDGLKTSVVPLQDDTKLGINITPGKAYVAGYEYSQIANNTIQVDKPRSADYQETITNVSKYDHTLPYFFVAGDYIEATGGLPAENTLVKFVDQDPVNTGQSVIRFDGASGVDDTTDIITTTNNHGLVDGSAVTYTSSDVSIGLTSGNTYYVSVVSDNEVKLADSFSGAINGATGIVDITTIGTAGINQYLKPLNQLQFEVYDEYSSYFVGTTGVDISTNSINFDTNHGFQTGDRIYYQPDAGDPIVIDGATGSTGAPYYAIITGSTGIKLASSYTAAKSGSSLSIGATGSGTQSFQMKAVDYDTDKISVRNVVRSWGSLTPLGSMLVGGYRYRVSTEDNDHAIGGLTHDTVYYLGSDTSSDGSSFGISETADGALKIAVSILSSQINLTENAGATSATHIFERATQQDTKTSGVVGYGVYKGIQYSDGDSSSSQDVYKMFFDNIGLEKGYTVNDVGGIQSLDNVVDIAVLHQIKVANVVPGISDQSFNKGDLLVPTVKGPMEPQATVYYYNDPKQTLYVTKTSEAPTPYAEGIVRDLDNNTTATFISSFVSNHDVNKYPLIEVDKDTIKTISNINYSVFSKTTATVISTDASISVVVASGNDVITSTSADNFVIFIPSQGKTVSLADNEITTTNNKTIVLTINEQLNPSTYGLSTFDIEIYSKITLSPVTVADKSANVNFQYGIQTPSSSWMPLYHQDVSNINQIVEGRTVKLDSLSGAGTSNEIEFSFTYSGATSAEIVTNDVVVIKGVTCTGNAAGTYDLDPSGNREFYNREYVVDLSSSPNTYGVDTITTTFTATFGATGAGSIDITNAVVALPPKFDLDSGEKDVTSKYDFFTGNTPHSVGVGMIKQKKGFQTPTGQLGVDYDYKSADSSADFVSVDSYGDHTSDPLTYIGAIANALDENNVETELRRYLDFRTTHSRYYFKNIGTMSGAAASTNVLEMQDLNIAGSTGATGALSFSMIGKTVTGPGINGNSLPTITDIKFNETTGNTKLILSDTVGQDYYGTYYVGLTSDYSIADTTEGAVSYSFPSSADRIDYDYVKFKPRNVSIYVNKEEKDTNIQYEDVTGLRDVESLRDNPNKLPLAYLEIDPYTVDYTDHNLIEFESPVYRMSDIDNLRKRVDRNEYYASLSLESDDINVDEETSRYGFWSEDFMFQNHQDFKDNDYQCTIYDNTYVSPGVVTKTIQLELDNTVNSGGWQQTGNVLTLPYSESKAITNSHASRGNNLNPYGINQWTGVIELYPHSDNWVDSGETDQEVTPPPTNPQPVGEEYITEIRNVRASWSPDSRNNNNAITFEWKTNTGRSGRVNTDRYLSPIINNLGKPAWNGTLAVELIGRDINGPIGEKGKFAEYTVKQYLNAGSHFDHKAPSAWKTK